MGLATWFSLEMHSSITSGSKGRSGMFIAKPSSVAHLEIGEQVRNSGSELSVCFIFSFLSLTGSEDSQPTAGRVVGNK